MNHLKITWKSLKNQLNYENTETKYLNNIRKNGILRVKSSLLELVKDFKELRYRELKDGDIEELFFKLIIVSI